MRKLNPFWAAAVIAVIMLLLLAFVLPPLLFPESQTTYLQNMDNLERGLRHHGLAVSTEARWRSRLRISALPLALAAGFGCYVFIKRRSGE